MFRPLADWNGMTLDDLFTAADFRPNEAQRQAIEHDSGPLFLVAGPGSGKTRVLLWRTVNLLVFKATHPGRIFLATFTEKAARQLREGLLSILALVTSRTGRPFDLAPMYVGTVHALCHRLLGDRAFSPGRVRLERPAVIDELDQYFLLSEAAYWRRVLGRPPSDGELPDLFRRINSLLGERPSASRHNAVTALASLFNRLSEEDLPAAKLMSDPESDLGFLLGLYAAYIDHLGPTRTDLSRLQQAAHRLVTNDRAPESPFDFVTIDEYQDTNAIQEKLYYALAGRSKNLCVVGDDDQALYRFRGATVESFVRFPERAEAALGCRATRIALATNYRSRPGIVEQYTRFIAQGTDWSRPTGGFYRLHDKGVTAFRRDHVPSHVESSDNPPSPAVVATSAAKGELVADELADVIARLIREKTVSDPNQIAVLFPSLKATPVARLEAALEARGVRVYAPRARRFLEAPEPALMVGLIGLVIGQPERSADFDRGDFADFHDWLSDCHRRARLLEKSDTELSKFIAARRTELAGIERDRNALLRVVNEQSWGVNDAYSPDRQKHRLLEASGLSNATRRGLGGIHLDRIARERRDEGRPFTLRYVINRATSLDWNLLDLFYRLCAFDPFASWFRSAETGEDEGPVFNLALTSQLLGKYEAKFAAIITAEAVVEKRLQRTFFTSFLYALYRRGEGEHEDAEDPFPRGRVPFLTIHQSKGLEFPVVVLGSTYRVKREARPIEKIIRPLLDGDVDPLDRLGDFDALRLIYVAMSRAKDLLIVTHLRGQGQQLDPAWKATLDGPNALPRLPELDIREVPTSQAEATTSTRLYSYTADYLSYLRCPRQYMLFRRYGFQPAQTQTMFFGSLVHETIEDLHNRLIAKRSAA